MNKKLSRFKKPITLEQVTKVKISNLPKEVIEAFNSLIVKDWNGRSSVISQDDVVKQIIKNFKKNNKKISKDKIFENHFLDIEGAYRRVGWKVTYDKPGYNENSEAFWAFEK